MYGKLTYIVALCSLLAACSGAADSEGKPLVFASILPQAYFAQLMAGGHVQIEVLVGPGQSPHSFEPTPKQMAKLSGAAAFLSAGMPFEKALLPRIKGSNPRIRIVNTLEGIEMLKSPAEHGHDEHNGHGHVDNGHSHGSEDMDPHVWLDPANAKTMAANICRALKEAAPGHDAEFDSALASLVDELDRLDREIAEALKPLEGSRIYVFHPAFGYFARAYGLEQVAVETGGKEPGAKQLASILESARKDGVRVIFVQPQFSKSSAQAIAREINGAVVPMDPLAKNYLENLSVMAAQIKKAVSEVEKK